MDKQKLEEARQLAMSMTSHPVAFGTIEHTERAGELLAEMVKANEVLAREAWTWSKACESATKAIAAAERACDEALKGATDNPSRGEWDDGYVEGVKACVTVVRAALRPNDSLS